MAEMENEIYTGTNPYDRLIQQETVPVSDPVILKAGSGEEKPALLFETEELVPLAEAAVYESVNIMMTETPDDIFLEVEEDLVVPDIEPDIDMILNASACIRSVEVKKDEDGSFSMTGKAGVEVMYRPSGSYGDMVSVITAPVDIFSKIEAGAAETENINVKATVQKIECRILNERKYRIKIFVKVCVSFTGNRIYNIFEGIKDEPVQMKKETVKYAELISRKKQESSLREELLINDEKVRPVKILKSQLIVSENHRQLTSGKLVLNATIWVRILYMAELASKGNLSNHPVLYLGKIDHTQFVPLTEDESETAFFLTSPDVSRLTVEINSDMNGFTVDGDVITDTSLFRYQEREVTADLYHMEQELVCDINEEEVCASMGTVLCGGTVRDSISLHQESGEDLKVIYLDGSVLSSSVQVSGGTATVSGKVQLEAVTINEGGYTVVAKKICDFSCSGAVSGHVEAEDIFVREMTADLTAGGQVAITVHIQAKLLERRMTSIKSVSNPCIIKNKPAGPKYPVTVYTVKAGETSWDIARKFRVPETAVLESNREEDIRAGQKIIIVK